MWCHRRVRVKSSSDRIEFSAAAEMGLDFQNGEYKFLSGLGLQAHNVGCYIAGEWKASGPIVTSVNPSNNKVLIRHLLLCRHQLRDL